MRHILVLGGTLFFGKRLVQKLIDAGDQVTIATRGIKADPFGDQVRRIILDRSNAEELQAAAVQEEWDVVYDNIGYSPDEAAMACRAFAGRTKRYIFVSTMSVYPFRDAPLAETAFDPYSYPLQYGTRHDFNYGEGKRLAEAVFFQEASFPVVSVRFPVIMGLDDYTQRLELHIDRIRLGQPIGLPNPDAHWKLITSEEAASFLFWLRDQTLTGPVNACSNGAISIGDMIAEIEQQTGKQAIIQSEETETNRSPYGILGNWVMDNTKATTAGFTFFHLSDWFPALVKELTHKG